MVYLKHIYLVKISNMREYEEAKTKSKWDLCSLKQTTHTHKNHVDQLTVLFHLNSFSTLTIFDRFFIKDKFNHMSR